MASWPDMVDHLSLFLPINDWYAEVSRLLKIYGLKFNE